ncbi:hypothetical protein MTO96_046281 [Rhipicephalus appendiculatus]
MFRRSLLVILPALLVAVLGQTIVVQTGAQDTSNIVIPSSSSGSTIVIKKDPPPKVYVINEEPSPVVVQVR